MPTIIESEWGKGDIAWVIYPRTDVYIACKHCGHKKGRKRWVVSKGPRRLWYPSFDSYKGKKGYNLIMSFYAGTENDISSSVYVTEKECFHRRDDARAEAKIRNEKEKEK